MGAESRGGPPFGLAPPACRGACRLRPSSHPPRADAPACVRVWCFAARSRPGAPLRGVSHSWGSHLCLDRGAESGTGSVPAREEGCGVEWVAREPEIGEDFFHIAALEERRATHDLVRHPDLAQLRLERPRLGIGAV